MLGSLHPIPFQIGGGPTTAEKIYRESRAALGENGAGPEGGLEDDWRKCRALALSKGLNAVERAAGRFFPNLGGEAVEVYEDLLGLAEEDTLGGRVDAVTNAYTQQFDAVVPGVAERLQAIDSTIEIEKPSSNTTTIARYGKPFKMDADDFGATSHTSHYPAYTEDAVLFVRWPGGIPDAEKRRLAERILNRDLPAWYDWVIFNAHGFYCDGFNNSYCDLTLLG